MQGGWVVNPYALPADVPIITGSSFPALTSSPELAA